MQNIKNSTFSLLIFLLLTTTNSNHESSSKMSDHCSIQVCKFDDPISRYVQFPFLINKNDSFPSFCGYPGFDLFCNGDDKLTIKLPNLGAFLVQEIDYVNQELRLINDLDNCLPKKLLSLDNDSSFVGKSPFLPTLEQDYWFFNCSNDFFNSTNLEPIECISGTNYGGFATNVEEISEGNNSSMCQKIGPIKVPKGVNERNSSSSILSGNFRLKWSHPRECVTCHEKNGRCRFKGDSNLDVECFFPGRGLTRNALVAIGLAFTAPLALVTFIIVYFVIKSVTNGQGRGSRGEGVTPTRQPQNTGHALGLDLDHNVIESYPKVVLGESRRLPKEDDVHCPICLGEYVAKESLRTIPDCGHCFHAECVDEWLRLNASCPVCRKYPSNKTPQIDDS